MQVETLRHCWDFFHFSSDKSDVTTIVQLNWVYVLLRLRGAQSASTILRNYIDEDPEVPYVIYLPKYIFGSETTSAKP